MRNTIRRSSGLELLKYLTVFIGFMFLGHFFDGMNYTQTTGIIYYSSVISYSTGIMGITLILLATQHRRLAIEKKEHSL